LAAALADPTVQYILAHQQTQFGAYLQNALKEQAESMQAAHAVEMSQVAALIPETPADSASAETTPPELSSELLETIRSVVREEIALYSRPTQMTTPPAPLAPSAPVYSPNREFPIRGTVEGAYTPGWRR